MRLLSEIPKRKVSDPSVVALRFFFKHTCHHERDFQHRIHQAEHFYSGIRGWCGCLASFIYLSVQCKILDSPYHLDTQCLVVCFATCKLETYCVITTSCTDGNTSEELYADAFRPHGLPPDIPKYVKTSVKLAECTRRNN